MADDNVLIQGSETIQVVWIIRYEYLFLESDGLILGKNGAFLSFTRVIHHLISLKRKVFTPLTPCKVTLL